MAYADNLQQHSIKTIGTNGTRKGVASEPLGTAGPGMAAAGEWLNFVMIS